RQANALEQAEQVEFGLGIHAGHDVLGREISHLDDEVFALVAKMLGQAGVSRRRQGLDVGQRGRWCSAPDQRIVKFAFHTNVLGQYAAATKSLTARLEWATVA